MKIGLDIDGVIYPWQEELYRYFQENKGYSGTYREFWLDYSHTLTESQWRFYVSIPFLYSSTTPRKDVTDTLPKLAELGEIYYITHRSPDLLHTTQKFLNLIDAPFRSNLVLTSDKPTYIRLLNIDYFLDDRTEVVKELEGITTAYLFRQVHNLNSRDGFNTVGSLREFYEIVKGRE